MQKYLLQLLQGVFIITVGAVGFLWDPRAKSAMISGAVFGTCFLYLPLPTEFFRRIELVVGRSYVPRWAEVG
jgi:hypothetical protein